jgi:hypothetical protein
MGRKRRTGDRRQRAVAVDAIGPEVVRHAVRRVQEPAGGIGHDIRRLDASGER